MASYTQFTQEERILLSALHHKGLTPKDISRELEKKLGYLTPVEVFRKNMHLS
jgi:IS30 family transposase